GDFPAYAPIAPPASKPGEFPIYVGRAARRGLRRSVEGLLAPTTEPVLYQRLCYHAATLDHAQNLLLQDFRCRYLVIDDVWAPVVEALMIHEYQPVWNQVLQGFGNYDSGGGRRGPRSDWDEIHPGRPWAARLSPAAHSAERISARIATHLSSVSSDARP